jgi:hypothetical protein
MRLSETKLKSQAEQHQIPMSLSRCKKALNRYGMDEGNQDEANRGY